MKLRIDLNCDMGEHDAGDAQAASRDVAILSLVSSANISCGAHAGDDIVTRETMRAAAAAGVAIGAHPGFADREHFGRRDPGLTAGEVYDLVRSQLRAFLEHAAAVNATVVHVKPHGALYNVAARDAATARAVVDSVIDTDARLLLYGLAGSELVTCARMAGLTVVAEAFGDRTYEADGSLTPRSLPGAVIGDADEVAARVVRMIAPGLVATRQGGDIVLAPDTICVHSDTPDSLASIRAIRTALDEHGIDVMPPDRP